MYGSYPITLLPGLLLAGVGMGLTVVPVTIAAVSGAGRGYAGIMAGLLTTCQQVGGALGVAVLSTVAAAHTNGFLHAHLAGPARLAHALVSGFDAAFLAAAALTATALLIAVIVLPRDSVAASPAPAATTVAGQHKTTTPHPVGATAPTVGRFPGRVSGEPLWSSSGSDRSDSKIRSHLGAEPCAPN